KPGHAQTGVSKNLSHAQFIPAGLDGRRVIASQTEPASGVRSRHDGPTAGGQDAADFLAFEGFDYRVSGHFRCFEVDGNSAIAPRVFQLMASVRYVNKLDIQLARGLLKTARLIA